MKGKNRDGSHKYGTTRVGDTVEIFYKGHGS